ncbi:cobalamin B12-binding domain-containing protein [Sorangium cellulosum]|uniref:cobalamin B12-binding domain-containing protein n=1 Tax=Sorangium cellulosum TaxID=56 RepID=UPI00133135C0|nr:B12-binding domain-containing protein [Sorangium cellulosum]
MGCCQGRGGGRGLRGRGGRGGAEARLFAAAILAGDYAAARGVLHAALDEGLGYIYERIVAPALEEVGHLWYENRLTVADEHLATAVAQAAIASTYPRIRWPSGGPRAVVGCVEPELHSLGARMVADLLALDGWQTTFASGGISLAAKIEDLRWSEVKLFAVSVTLPAHLPAARALIGQVREELPEAKILAGGRAIAALPDAAEQLGIHAVASSGSMAVEIARGWR